MLSLLLNHLETYHQHSGFEIQVNYNITNTAFYHFPKNLLLVVIRTFLFQKKQNDTSVTGAQECPVRMITFTACRNIVSEQKANHFLIMQ